ncbi:hypothetical protein HMPREF0240_03185 [Clostridium sp. D5]|nr:hypothetical protein HMPREF0240_03185 [Clostridium sp. D5]
MQDAPFKKAFTPFNERLSTEDSHCPFNKYGIPCCPKDPSLSIKREGSKSHLRCGDSTYKIRGNVEKAINHFKDSFCVAGRITQNEKTLHADLLLAGIS